MRRAFALLVLIVAGLAIAAAKSPGGGGDYRVAAVFDTAKGMVAGQQVKIAGAVVGEVEEVELTATHKARMVLAVEERFSPFRADASCRILPEGLISENYVDCDPGRSERPLASPGGTPTVGLARTATPVSLQDLFDVFRVPTSQRMRVLFNELGLATAGRGEDLNALLRRANPALRESRRVLSILDRQRAQLGRAITRTDRVLGSLADGSGDVRRLVGRAADVAEATARHSGALGESVRRLPAMLDELRPGLASLDRAMESTTPVLGHLRAAAPHLTDLTRTVPAFTRTGTPAVRALAASSRRGRPAVRALAPVVRQLARATGPLVPFARDLARLLTDTRDSGGIEGALRVGYAFGTDGSLYDETSHVLGFHLSGAPDCIAADNAGVNLSKCNHKYSAPGRGQVPVNAPDCGPQGSDKLWNNGRCGTGFPSIAKSGKRGRLLLDYLLK